MDSHRLAIKLFVVSSPPPRLEAFVPVFHSFIQNHSVADHLLIDVADYKHVTSGPGILLVAHEGNFSIDMSEGRMGLMYVRKQPLPGDFRLRIGAVFSFVSSICRQLETEPTLKGLRFGNSEAIFRIHDRLLAPNTPETFAAVKGDVEAALKSLMGGRVGLEHRGAARELFEIRIKAG